MCDVSVLVAAGRRQTDKQTDEQTNGIQTRGGWLFKWNQPAGRMRPARLEYF